MKKRQYADRKAAKFCNARDSVTFWKLAKELNGKKKGISSTVEANRFKIHFEALLNPETPKIQIYGPDPYIFIQELDQPISDVELRLALRKCRDGKAPGLNRITNEFYKYGSEALVRHLVRAFNLLYDEGSIPEDYLKAIIFPLHKKGDRNEVENYSGI